MDSKFHYNTSAEGCYNLWTFGLFKFLEEFETSQPFQISHTKEHPEKYDLPVLDTSDEVESFRKLMYKKSFLYTKDGELGIP